MTWHFKVYVGKNTGFVGFPLAVAADAGAIFQTLGCTPTPPPSTLLFFRFVF